MLLLTWTSSFDVKRVGRYVLRLIADQSERLRYFLRDHVSGYEELQALLLLAREAGQDWTESEVAESLNVPVELVSSALESLLSTGMVEVVRRGNLTAFRYAPKTDILRGAVVELQRAYSEQRLTVMQMMSANALERVRTATLRRFADAFRLERSRK
jgi:DNA-binding transcriptional ArsR family regulator